MEETPDVLPALAKRYEETLPQIDRALGGETSSIRSLTPVSFFGTNQRVNRGGVP
jgi:hypothetical protein